MNKTAKGVVTAAAVASGALVGACGLIYEGVLSRTMIEFLSKHKIFGDKEVENKYESPEAEKGYEWFRETAPAPAVIVGENKEQYYAYIARNKVATHNWAICVHGYSGEPSGVSNFGRHYYEEGFNVLFPCMRGHSLDRNKYCSMGYYDKDIVCAWIKKIISEDKDAKILLHGVSMGAATTMLVTGEDLSDNVVCAVADCGYTTCWDEYKAQIGEMLHLPVYPFLPIINKISVLRGNFDFKKCSPIEAVGRSKTPTLFIHGQEDTFVPYSMMDKLYNACAAEKDKLTVSDAVHAVSSLVHPDMYWAKVDEFTAKYFDSKVEAKK
ncbi:MAG: alpha/beta hydrolase [Oscillospiraceae bacterium]|nr:alpha/beta hydrolase [Oscillospiraceae bacterium]